MIAWLLGGTAALVVLGAAVAGWQTAGWKSSQEDRLITWLARRGQGRKR